MDFPEIQQQYVRSDDDVARPPYVKILVGMIFAPALLLFVTWGWLFEVILKLVPPEATAAARNVLYYIGLACAAAMGIGILMLIAGYFGLWRGDDASAESSGTSP